MLVSYKDSTRFLKNQLAHKNSKIYIILIVVLVICQLIFLSILDSLSLSGENGKNGHASTSVSSARSLLHHFSLDLSKHSLEAAAEEDILKYLHNENNPTEDDWVCPFEHPNKDKLADLNQPKYTNVRPDKYLFSATPYGPSNQIRGLRDTIILAYYLNRTVVLPDFTKHESDPTYMKTYHNNEFNKLENLTVNIQNINQKIDVFILSKFINVITLSELAKKEKNNCKSRMDIALFARKFSENTGSQHNHHGLNLYRQLQAYDAMYGYKITNKNKNFKDFLENPDLADLQIFPDTAITDENSEIHEDLGNNLKFDHKSGAHSIFLKNNNASIQEAYAQWTHMA